MEGDDIEDWPSENDTQEYPYTIRAIKQCSTCHKPKEGNDKEWLDVHVHVNVFMFMRVDAACCCVHDHVHVLVLMHMCCTCACACCSGKYHLIGKKRVMLSHTQVCEGKCTARSCTHRSHKPRKQTQATTTTSTMSARDKQALLAGFKPIDNAQFKQHVQQKMQEAGVDKK